MDWLFAFQLFCAAVAVVLVARWLRSNRRKPRNMLDEFIFLVYGNPPPPKRASVRDAAKLAFEQLLMRRVSEPEVRAVADELSSGPIPYSTHDLALSIALNFFKQPARIDDLREAQVQARLKMADWVQAGFAVPVIAGSFEEVLYKLYKPAARPGAKPERPVPDAIKKAYVEGMAIVVGVQLELGRTDAALATTDLWIAGYIFGAHFELLQHHGLELTNGPSAQLMAWSYAGLFPTPSAAGAALQAVTSRAMQEDAAFLSGREVACAEVKDWLVTGKRPERLTDRLFSTSRA